MDSLSTCWKDTGPFDPFRVAGLVFICVLISILLSCRSSVPQDRVLFDFESDGELDRFHWKCHTLFSLSEEHATRGTSSLKLELFPSDFPGLSPMLEDNDWRGFKQLAFDVFNTEEEAIQITVRMDDTAGFPNYEDRYNKIFNLKPGQNTVVIPFETLVTSGTQRRLDLKRIYRLLVFMGYPKKRIVLYMDHFRLS